MSKRAKQIILPLIAAFISIRDELEKAAELFPAE